MRWIPRWWPSGGPMPSDDASPDEWVRWASVQALKAARLAVFVNVLCAVMNGWLISTRTGWVWLQALAVFINGACTGVGGYHWFTNNRRLRERERKNTCLN